jgi:hypothetical protein
MVDDVHRTRQEQDLVLKFCLAEAVALSIGFLVIPCSELIDATIEVPFISVAFAAGLKFFIDVGMPSSSKLFDKTLQLTTIHDICDLSVVLYRRPQGFQ